MMLSQRDFYLYDIENVLRDLLLFLRIRITHPGTWLIASIEWILVSAMISSYFSSVDINQHLTAFSTPYIPLLSETLAFADQLVSPLFLLPLVVVAPLLMKDAVARVFESEERREDWMSREGFENWKILVYIFLPTLLFFIPSLFIGYYVGTMFSGYVAFLTQGNAYLFDAVFPYSTQTRLWQFLPEMFPTIMLSISWSCILFASWFSIESFQMIWNNRVKKDETTQQTYSLTQGFRSVITRKFLISCFGLFIVVGLTLSGLPVQTNIFLAALAVIGILVLIYGASGLCVVLYSGFTNVVLYVLYHPKMRITGFIRNWTAGLDIFNLKLGKQEFRTIVFGSVLLITGLALIPANQTALQGLIVGSHDEAYFNLGADIKLAIDRSMRYKGVPNEENIEHMLNKSIYPTIQSCLRVYEENYKYVGASRSFETTTTIFIDPLQYLASGFIRDDFFPNSTAAESLTVLASTRSGIILSQHRAEALQVSIGDNITIRAGGYTGFSAEILTWETVIVGIATVFPPGHTVDQDFAILNLEFLTPEFFSPWSPTPIERNPTSYYLIKTYGYHDETYERLLADEFLEEGLITSKDSEVISEIEEELEIRNYGQSMFYILNLNLLVAPLMVFIGFFLALAIPSVIRREMILEAFPATNGHKTYLILSLVALAFESMFICFLSIFVGILSSIFIALLLPSFLIPPTGVPVTLNPLEDILNVTASFLPQMLIIFVFSVIISSFLIVIQNFIRK